MTPRGAPSVAVRESGRTAFATPNTATYNAISAETVDTDSAKLLRTALINLKGLRKMEPRFYVAHPTYFLIAKYASPSQRG